MLVKLTETTHKFLFSMEQWCFQSLGINLVLDVLSPQPSLEHNKSEDQAFWDVILSHIQEPHYSLNQ
jgi:hypothetical protein